MVQNSVKELDWSIDLLLAYSQQRGLNLVDGIMRLDSLGHRDWLMTLPGAPKKGYINKLTRDQERALDILVQNRRRWSVRARLRNLGEFGDSYIPADQLQELGPDLRS